MCHAAMETGQMNSPQKDFKKDSCDAGKGLQLEPVITCAMTRGRCKGQQERWKWLSLTIAVRHPERSSYGCAYLHLQHLFIFSLVRSQHNHFHSYQSALTQKRRRIRNPFSVSPSLFSSHSSLCFYNKISFPIHHIPFSSTRLNKLKALYNQSCPSLP